MADRNFVGAEARVFVENLRLTAYVGVGRLERQDPQVVVVGISCELMERAFEKDEISATLDYVPIVKAVRVLALNSERRLLETFAQEIAAVCFESPKVGKATVTVRKPNKLPGCDAVGITRVFVRAEG